MNVRDEYVATVQQRAREIPPEQPANQVNTGILECVKLTSAAVLPECTVEQLKGPLETELNKLTPLTDR